MQHVFVQALTSLYAYLLVRVIDYQWKKRKQVLP
jgi:hypothetical protein